MATKGDARLMWTELKAARICRSGRRGEQISTRSRWGEGGVMKPGATALVVVDMAIPLYIGEVHSPAAL